MSRRPFLSIADRGTAALKIACDESSADTPGCLQGCGILFMRSLQVLVAWFFAGTGNPGLAGTAAGLRGG